MKLIDPAPFLAYAQKMRSARYAADALMRSELNTATDRHLGRCKKNTPVGVGPDSPTLRDRWDRSGVHGMADGLYSEVFNTAHYAAYWEFGHRQKPGRVIFIELSPGGSVYGRPAVQVKKGKLAGKWGVSLMLKKNYVKGRFVMTDSEKKAKRGLDAAVRRIEASIRGALK